MTHESVEARIREARLIVARPDEVAAELKLYGEQARERGLFSADEDLEKSLLARHEPVIDIALARHGTSEDVLRTLYNQTFEVSPDPLKNTYLKGLRLAFLSNEVFKRLFRKFPQEVIGEQELQRILVEGDDHETLALLTNPSLSEDILEHLYKGDKQLASLANDRRRKLVAYSSRNPRLSRNEENEEGPDLGYMGIHEGIYELLRSVPVEQKWLFTLRELLNALDAGDVRTPSEDIAPILKRWAELPLPADDKFTRGYYTELSMVDEFRCLVAAMYGQRFTDGKLVLAGSKGSADLALRCAYYGQAELSEKDMRDGHRRDKAAYALAALCNDSLFLNRDKRALLETQLTYDMKGIYLRRCKQIHSRKRKWFNPKPMTDGFSEDDGDAPDGESASAKIEAALAQSMALLTSMKKSVRIILGLTIVIAIVLLLRRGFIVL